MREYPHIDSVYKRDPKGKFMVGEYSTPEFKYLEDLPWRWTEKIDGTNIRIMWDGSKFTLGGKTDNAQIPTKLANYLTPITNAWYEGISEGNIDASTIFLFAEHEKFAPVCLYGEGYGAGIQKGGGLYSPDQKFILFDVKIGPWWLERSNVEDIAAKLGLDVVWELDIDFTLVQMIEKVRADTNTPIPSFVNNDASIEGWVGTPSVPLFNRKGERIITKIKYKDFMSV